MKRLFAITLAALIAASGRAQTTATSQPVVQSPPAEAALLSGKIPSPLPPVAPWTRTERAVPEIAPPPRIDGVLDDPAWKQALHAAGFYRVVGNAPIPNQTEVWIGADRKNLYFAFHCQDSQPELIRAQQTQRNGTVQSDDYIGIDIDSQGSRRGFSTFAVTAGGVQWEQVEGGTADNVTWAGDWKAASRRVPDGWVCEVAIPYALLRYPKGTEAMGIQVYRKVARETTLQVWPSWSPEIMNDELEAQVMDAFTGLHPPYYAPRPVFLPYILAVGGTENRVRAGMDVKYPLTKAITGVATLFPDFETVEQAVTDISFSYTEKFLTDRRPFFAEGSAFLPDIDMFYSRRIEKVDGGLKVVGKQDQTTIGALETYRAGSDHRNDVVVNMYQGLGLRNGAGFSLVSDSPSGASNTVGRLSGTYSFDAGPTNLTLSTKLTQSWLAGKAAGSDTFLRLNSDPLPGRPFFYLDYMDISPDFTSNLGFVPERNIRGAFLRTRLFNSYDRGPISHYEAWINSEYYDRHTGGFFRGNVFSGFYVQNQPGLGLFVEIGRERREGFLPDLPDRTPYHDRINTVQFSWGNKTLLRKGEVFEIFGRRAGQTYNYLSVDQGFALSGRLTAQAAYSRTRLGDARATQAILNGSYRLDSESSLGARLVRQGHDNNLFLSYGRQVRSGTDIFVLFGEPDPMKSTRTRNKITVKLLRPF